MQLIRTQTSTRGARSFSRVFFLGGEWSQGRQFGTRRRQIDLTTCFLFIFFCRNQIRILFTSRKAIFFLPAAHLWLALILCRLQSAMYTNLFIWKTQRKLVSHLRHMFFFLFFPRNNRTMNSVRAPVVFNWCGSVFLCIPCKVYH